MAAGRLGVSRTRDFYNSSKTEYDNHYRNGTHRDHDVKQKSGRRLSSGAHDLGSREDGFGLWSKIEAREEWKNDGVRVLPGKKRKFSPIVWDREEKEAKRVRIWSKNRVVPTGTANLSPQSLNGSSVSDGGVSEIPLSANHVHGREILPVRPQMACGYDESVESEPHATLSPSLSQEQFGSGDLEDVVEERDFVEAPNISMSRWASDSNSPRGECLSDSDTEDFPKRKPKVQNRSRSETILDVEGTSPESGEFWREGSEDGVQLCGSEERSRIVGLASENEYFENELDKHDFMDCGKTPDKNAGVSPVNSDFEDDGNSSWSEEPRINMLQACRSVFEYERLNKINEGTYGVVYKARDKKTGEFVALKKVKMDVSRSEEGFPLTSLREINILLSFHHPSIVNVKQVAMGDLDSVFMVMEYMEHDLKGLIEVRKHPFRISEVKCLMLQLLEGVRYLHDNWVLHRDLKPSNLLMNNRGDLKICDFGMSRQYGGLLKPYTALVVTLWYRAPELLLGSKNYSTAIDMWSVGCIMAELLAKEPLFRGKTEIEQLDKIFKTLGTPNETSWPGYSKLPGVKGNFVKQPYNLLRKKFPATSFIGSPTLTDSGFDLLNKLLTYDPEKRISAEAALNHDWFQEVPLPTSKDFMPTFPVPHAQYLTR